MRHTQINHKRWKDLTKTDLSLANYPYGSFDDQSIQMLKKRGCKLALTTEVAIASTNQDMRFVMPRIDTNDLPKNQNAEKNHWYSKG